MTRKNIGLAASLMALVAISGPAFAGTAKASAWHETAGLSDLQSAHAFSASHASMQTEPAAINTHPYHGGPKYND
jgi:hypothetical protein